MVQVGISGACSGLMVRFGHEWGDQSAPSRLYKHSMFEIPYYAIHPFSMILNFISSLFRNYNYSNLPNTSLVFGFLLRTFPWGDHPVSVRLGATLTHGIFYQLGFYSNEHRLNLLSGPWSERGSGHHDYDRGEFLKISLTRLPYYPWSACWLLVFQEENIQFPMWPFGKTLPQNWFVESNLQWWIDRFFPLLGHPSQTRTDLTLTWESARKRHRRSSAR